MASDFEQLQPLRGAARDRNAAGDHAVGAEHADGEIGDVHRAALAAAIAGGAAVELRHHARGIGALGDRVAVAAVIRRQPVVLAQIDAHARPPPPPGRSRHAAAREFRRPCAPRARSARRRGCAPSCDRDRCRRFRLSPASVICVRWMVRGLRRRGQAWLKSGRPLQYATQTPSLPQAVPPPNHHRQRHHVRPGRARPRGARRLAWRRLCRLSRRTGRG